MKKRLAVATAALMFAGLGAGVVQAAPPSDNTKNDHGICTAYFNGQKKGHDKEGRESAPGPFAALEASGSLDEIFAGCGGAEGIGGNGEENGRFTECWTNSDDDPDNNCADG